MYLVNRKEQSDFYLPPENTQWAWDGEDLLEIEDLVGSIALGSYDRKTIEEGTIEEILSRLKAIPLEYKGDGSPDFALTEKKWHKKHSPIFEYIVSFNEANKDFVLDFFSSVDEEWASIIKAGDVPPQWDLTQLSETLWVLVFKATLPMAVQYGRGESIAQRAEEYQSVEFCKRLSDLHWAGMELTNPISGAREMFYPGELHLTSISDLANKISEPISKDYVVGYMESQI